MTPACVAPYASMIEPSFPVNAITAPQPREVVVQVAAPAEPKKKPRKKNKKRNKPSKWADQCMYAELLEMSPEDPWSSTTDDLNDSLPHDLETGWVAVAPVPVGKRCLAVTHQSSGVAGVGSLSSLPSSPGLMSTPFFFVQCPTPLCALVSSEKPSSLAFHHPFPR